MDIGDEISLLNLAEKSGLDLLDLKEQLNNGSLKAEVQKDEDEARKLGINSIPHFIIDGKYSISGAQSSSNFLNLLNNAYSNK